MVGCSGIQGTIIPLFLGRSEKRKTVELRFVRFIHLEFKDNGMKGADDGEAL